ncbi:NADH-quinone oxidoreductase subunit C [Candidatus Deianiraea vastatrix]|uniref:NADH-quinone oxidoreductase chain 5 n=1 Tax=Candidatus Deianiraea vastatrix TaxID=2163644 RepID=A0A5B8XE23_9RICK|nr:NADH-quinone oxidoreductase subunit C [Candidatus Deianiraea vastatrix]QED23480.1 NADH-quinone oxidoreductase chain 5 [Candidatus Deianiraea vastatrix]
MQNYYSENADKIKDILKNYALVEYANNECIVNIKNPDENFKVLELIKNSDAMLGKCLIGIFATHYPNRDNEFSLQYLLLSMRYNLRFRIVIDFKADDVIKSVSDVFAGSTWYEREAFDMFGVKFANLTDERRLLNDYNFKHHPLRKDFPVTGYDEVRYNPVLEKVEYSKINLAQEYRDFDTQSSFDVSAVFEKIKG